jgi:hypothetical protein
MSDPSPLDADAEADLHRRLSALDPVATAELATAFLEPLIANLRCYHPKIDDAIRVQAAADAILALLRNPASCRQDASLWDYLRMSAKWDLVNAVDSETTHRLRLVSFDSVEHDVSRRNGLREELDAPTRLALLEELEIADATILAAVRQRLTDAECLVLDRMLEGERRTEVFAALLGIGDRPPAEQRMVVKRLKDKIDVRLRRSREES